MNKQENIVSVVIPTYNRAHLITDALNSIVEQSYRPLEVIVVDDGSEDDTEQQVENWKRAYSDDEELSVRYVHQENQGGNVARNRGIQEALGGCIAFLDSDDVWHPSKLEKQISVMKHDDEVGAVYCGLQQVDLESGKIVEVHQRTYPQGKILDQMLVHDVTSPTSTYVVRRSVFDNVGCFDVDLQARQDWDMWIRVAAAYTIACVPEVLVDFGDHSGPRTFSNPDKEIHAYHRIMEKYAVLRGGCSFSVRQSAKASFYRRMGRVHLHYKQQRLQALFFYLKAVSAWPFVFDSYAALAGVFLPQDLRSMIHRGWNLFLGKTRFAIKSH